MIEAFYSVLYLLSSFLVNDFQTMIDKDKVNLIPCLFNVFFLFP